jgi:hypothetical protein
VSRSRHRATAVAATSIATCTAQGQQGQDVGQQGPQPSPSSGRASLARRPSRRGRPRRGTRSARRRRPAHDRDAPWAHATGYGRRRRRPPGRPGPLLRSWPPRWWRCVSTCSTKCSVVSAVMNACSRACCSMLDLLPPPGLPAASVLRLWCRASLLAVVAHLHYRPQAIQAASTPGVAPPAPSLPWSGRLARRPAPGRWPGGPGSHRRATQQPSHPRATASPWVLLQP